MKRSFGLFLLSILFWSSCKKDDNSQPNNSANSWIEVMNGFGLNVVPYGIQSLNGKLFAMTVYGGVYVSTDNGSSWSHTPSASLPQDNSGGGTYYSSFGKAGTQLFVSLANGPTYISYDESNSWSAINSLNFNSYGFSGDGSPVGSNYYCIKTSNGQFYKSTNNGITWSSSNSGLPTAGVSTYLLAGNLIAASSSPAKIYYSNNNGNSWNFMSNVSGAAIVTQIISTNSHYLLATVSGIYLTPDLLNFTLTTNGIPSSINVNSIVNDGDKVLCSSFGDSYYSGDGGSSWAVITDIPQGVSNFQMIAFVNGYAFAIASGKLYRKQY